MTPYLIFILLMLLLRYGLDLLAALLNVGHVRDELPAEFEGYYDADKYAAAQRYLRDTTRFEVVSDSFSTLVTIVAILGGVFNLVDLLARQAGLAEIGTGLLFGALLIVLSRGVELPFSIYHTFVLEERYGFNKTTPRTFAVDQVKTLWLIFLLGGTLFAGIIWFFDEFGGNAWLYCWGAVTLFQVAMVFAAPYVIMPLFNKFEPLEEGELRSAIEAYAQRQGFAMKGVFKMDGSKRSGKSNAFFTGFGRSRRIVLFDTLIEKHTVPELVAVIAHEMGHYKRKHVLKAMARSVLTTGLMFGLLSLFIRNAGLFAAFRMEHVSIYASLVFFGFLYTPISLMLGIAEHWISRAHEFEADHYVVTTTGDASAMIDALKKLSVDNLSNLTPHPLEIFLHYSHPPVLERIRALRPSSPRPE